MTVYVPDDLAAEVKAELGDSNVSAICQAALRAELDRVRARAQITKEGFSRVEVFDKAKGRDVAFQGREIAGITFGYEGSETAWLTPKGNIAVYNSVSEYLSVYDSFDDFTADDQNTDLLAQAAEALGEKYTEDLDI